MAVGKAPREATQAQENAQAAGEERSANHPPKKFITSLMSIAQVQCSLTLLASTFPNQPGKAKQVVTNSSLIMSVPRCSVQQGFHHVPQGRDTTAAAAQHLQNAEVPTNRTTRLTTM